MGNKIIWVIFCLLTLFLTGYLLFFAKLEPAGDIVEYYGITESVLNHQGFNLTAQDQNNLSTSLHAVYFQDPQYYITGKDGNRYPVHFIFYSIIAIPVRLVLRLFQLDEMKTLTLTNLAILTIVSFIILKKFLPSPFKKGVFLLILYLSPLISFIIWPGPDLFYVSFLLLALYFFYAKKYLPAVILTILASWHSQPLIVIALASLGYYLIQKTRKYLQAGDNTRLFLRLIFTGSILLFLILIPYFYNLIVFGVLTPWTIIKNGWTQLNGFGLQNASLKKLYEQFFDLNIGLFWYAPLLFLAFCFFYFKSLRKHKNGILILLIILVTAIFYQTNPAWHYGTSGYGPTRHILFVLPFMVYFIVKYFHSSLKYLILLSAIIVSQIFTLSLNGFLTPTFANTLYQSPYASLVLNRIPQFYNPTPEIFVDRTNHTDLDHLTSAVYTDNGVCKKAFIMETDMAYLEKECGFIPDLTYQKINLISDPLNQGLYVNY